MSEERDFVAVIERTTLRALRVALLRLLLALC